MKDRLPLYPGRVKLVPVSGQENVYDMTRADQPTQEGDPLNKATLLADATAALFGLGTDAVPDDVLALLSKAALYKTVGQTAGLYDVSNNLLLTLPGVQIATGSYVGTGKYGESSPNSLTFDTKILAVFLMGSSSSGEYYPLFGGENNREVHVMSKLLLSTEYRDNVGFSLDISGENNYGKLSNDGKTISWYTTYSAYKQGNFKGYTYYYMALLI